MITEAEKVKHPVNKRANDWNKQFIKKKLKLLISILKDANIFSHQGNNLKLFDIAVYPS